MSKDPPFSFTLCRWLEIQGPLAWNPRNLTTALSAACVCSAMLVCSMWAGLQVCSTMLGCSTWTPGIGFTLPTELSLQPTFVVLRTYSPPLPHPCVWHHTDLPTSRLTARLAQHPHVDSDTLSGLCGRVVRAATVHTPHTQVIHHQLYLYNLSS